MLAHDYEKHNTKIVYPAAIQPKLDGIRCIAIIKDNLCTLWSRNQKQISSCIHIESALLNIFKSDTILDGELYNHELKHAFEKIVSSVRKDDPTPEALNIQYHIYDTVNLTTFQDRLHNINHIPESEYIKVVDTTIVTEIELPDKISLNTAKGYEGTIIRNLKSLYEQKRSFNLQKIKDFQDAEFKIVGIEEGKGKLKGLLGAFICEHNGNTFNVKFSGNVMSTKKYLYTKSLWEGKLLTVKFQGFTNKNKVPRFPIGIVIRDYE
jgi:ATP-dependent DNA ligase